MLATILLSAAIVLYAGWVLRKTYRQWKSGNGCQCGCNHCAGKQQCRK